MLFALGTFSKMDAAKVNHFAYTTMVKTGGAWGTGVGKRGLIETLIIPQFFQNFRHGLWVGSV